MERQSSQRAFPTMLWWAWQRSPRWFRVGCGLILSSMLTVLILVQGYCWAW